MRQQQSYQNRNKGFFGKVINRFKGLFTSKQRINKVPQPKQNETRPSPKHIRRHIRNVSVFGCKPKSTSSAIKQFAQMKRDHGHLWNGSIKATI